MVSLPLSIMNKNAFSNSDKNTDNSGLLNQRTMLGTALTGLGLLANRNLRAASPLFGKPLANLARQHGIAFKITPKDINNVSDFFQTESGKSYLQSTLKNIRNYSPNILGLNSKNDYSLIQDLVKKLTLGKIQLTPSVSSFKGPVLDIIGRGKNVGNVLGRSTTSKKSPNAFGSENKFTEAEIFKGSIPKTVNFNDLRNLINSKKIRTWKDANAYIKKHVGGDYILKPQYGARSEGLILPEEISSRNMMRFINTGRGKLKDYIIQKYNPIKETSRLEDLTNLISMATNPLSYAKGSISKDTAKSVLKDVFNFRKPYTSWGSHEYRINALDGKVIPHSVYNKALGGGYYGSSLFYGKKERMLEDFTQKALSKLKGKQRQGLMGFDVAIGKDGKPFIIEANPVVAGDITQISGAVTDPRIMKDLYAGIAGKNPYRVNRQLALTTAPGLALTGSGIMQGD